ncbi:MAG: pyrroloquinoline quinone biosynthesis protein [Gomphosphaeria aponina SAG 52.96 = DSM 107014]|uniref:Pyrroloquinoline quinone biosynthesis protein n=1 Tax=Gomphosphaeria aponina SAG 52.96 = DSM 107014 TaxID=1521640 RepID=A0A941GS37_9CHRO|nr:pyrroloquinoline quinone biosynthesis protein [Gomphosphaeria aponina SAG 52.96 = DSM 107014]
MGYKYINQLASPENVKTFLEFVDLAAGAGKDVNNVWDIGDKMRNSKQMQLCLRTIQQEPACAQMLKEKYMGPAFDIEALLKMPKGSLGWTYAKIMSTLGYDPQFYRVRDNLDEDIDYIASRIHKTHDIHHIVTGFSLDGLGELGVISVTVAQTRYPTFLFLDLISLLMTFMMSDKLATEATNINEQGRTLKYQFDLISDGLKIGQEAKPLFPVKWEEGWERPLDEWREELNIKPVLEGPYSWYSKANLQEAIA